MGLHREYRCANGGLGMKLVEIVRQTPWAVVLLVVLAATLAVLPLALLPGSLSTVQAVLASVGSIVLLVFALFGLVHDTFSAWQLVAALCVLVLVAGSALYGWRLVEQSRPLTVTDEVKLTGAEQMEHEAVAFLTVKVPRTRDLLRVTIGMEDLSHGSQCGPSSVLRLTGAGLDGAVETEAGEETPVALDRDERTVRLTVELRTDEGCSVSLDVKKAVLVNR